MRNLSTFFVSKTVPIVVLSLLTSSGCSLIADLTAPETISITGSVYVVPAFAVLPDGEWAGLNNDPLVNGGGCESGSGYTDIASGGQVTMTSGSGEIVAIGNLGSGVQDLGGRSLTAFDFFNQPLPICKYAFQLDVPGGEDFYSLSLGNSSRGQLSYTETELSQGIIITLGG
jgi:hypothetical protein